MKTLVAAASVLALSACATAPSSAQSFSTSGKSLREVYEYLHANPELSFQERNSSRVLAAEMKTVNPGNHFHIFAGLRLSRKVTHRFDYRRQVSEELRRLIHAEIETLCGRAARKKGCCRQQAKYGPRYCLHAIFFPVIQL